MALSFGLPELRLDPRIEDFIQRRSAGNVPPPESDPPSEPTEEQAPLDSAAESPSLRSTAMDAGRNPYVLRAGSPPDESAPPQARQRAPEAPEDASSGFSPEDLYRKASEADRKQQRANVLGSNLDRAAAMMLGERVGPLAVEVPTEVRDYLARLKMSGRALDPTTAARLELLRAQIEKTRAGKGADEPAPADWGAPPGTTMKNAIRLGYGRAPKPINPDDEPASTEEVEELVAKGFPAWGGMTKGEYKKAKDRLWGVAENRKTAIAAAGRSVDVAEKKEQSKRDAEKGEARATFGNDWTPDPTSPLLTNETAKQSFLDSMANVTEMEGLADELRSIIKRGVGITSDAKTKTQVRNLVAKMQLKQKDIDKLGVLSVTDISEFMLPQLAEPTGWDATWKQWTGQFDPIAQLDQYLSNIRKQVRNKADRMAVKPTPTGAFAKFWPRKESGKSKPSVPPPPPGTPSGFVPYVSRTGEYRYNKPGITHPLWTEVK